MALNTSINLRPAPALKTRTNLKQALSNKLFSIPSPQVIFANHYPGWMLGLLSSRTLLNINSLLTKTETLKKN
jgi:hypothetical protein